MRYPKLLGVYLIAGFSIFGCKTSETESEFLSTFQNQNTHFIIDGSYVPVSELNSLTVDLTNTETTISSMKRISGIQLENFGQSFHPAMILVEFLHETLQDQERQLSKIQGDSFSNIEVPYRHSDVRGIISATWKIKELFSTHIFRSMLLTDLPPVVKILGQKLIIGIENFREQHGAVAARYLVGVKFDFKHHLIQRLSRNLTPSFSEVPPKLKAAINNIRDNWEYLKVEKEKRGLFHGNIVSQLQDFSDLTEVQENILRLYLTDISIPENSSDTASSLNSVVDMQFSYDLFSNVGFDL